MMLENIYKRLLLVPLLCCSLVSAQETPFTTIQPVAPAFTNLPFGVVKPGGWIQQQIQDNLNGFTGHLDSLVPQLVVEDDIYAKNRLSKKIKSKDVGALGEGGDWQVQFLWWNSETQSNWWDGYIRSAVLANDTAHLARIEKYINKILATQDADGYLGIYDKELRYTFDNENGELWAKTTLLRGLLAWFEFKGDKSVFTAVQRSVDNVMDNWPINASHPFNSVNPNVGGLSHGLVFTDVLEEVYRLTGEQKYLDYALFLYKDFSEQELNEDAQYKKLNDASRKLTGHGVHTYEHLRTVALAYYTSGNPALKVALEKFENKILQETAPSGGPVGDEWIAGKPADATTRGYEYCSLQELLHSYASLQQKSGNGSYGDKIEHLFFNAAQGARNPQHSCIAYLKSDNSYAMTGGLNGDTSDKNQTRYSYSPVHKEAAVCCVPNAGRIAPYYVQNMWLKEGNESLVASLLGPCEVTTSVNNKTVIIKEVTEYPYGNTLKFAVTADNVAFTLKIRLPEWGTDFKINAHYTVDNGFISIHKTWTGTETITLEFMPDIETKQDNKGEYYFTYGPLVLAHPIEAEEKKIKFYPLPGFADLHYTSKNMVIYQYDNAKLKKKGNSLIFETKLYNPKTGKGETVTLVPMGQTILRQVTF